MGRLYIKIADSMANMEEPSFGDVDFSDPDQAAIWKTVQVLLNKVIYADSYLEQLPANNASECNPPIMTNVTG